MHCFYINIFVICVLVNCLKFDLRISKTKPFVMVSLRILFIFCISLLSASWLCAQTSNVEFGKNRIQHHDDFDTWLQYETPNFITYWYGKARNVGQAAVQLAELDHDEIQGILEHRINDKIELIVYGDLTDLKQSNIGSEEAFLNNAGQTKVVGNKVFIYFNGDHNHLRKQIREGIASVYLNAMLFGSNLQEIVQNAVMLNLPNWFKEGLVSYIGESWNTDLDNKLKDLIMNDDFRGFRKEVEEHPYLLGQSLWFYMGENYGKSTVSNLLYLTRINRSIESGFLYVLGNSFDRTLKEWESFFKSRYSRDAVDRDSIIGTALNIKNKRNTPISNVKMSPNGRHLIYVENEIGKIKVFLYDLEENTRKQIFKIGFRNAFQATDYNFPLIAWKPNGAEVSILYEKRDVAYLYNLDVATGLNTTEPLDPQYMRVLSMDYFNNSEMVFSAIVNGYSDLFIYQTINRQTQRITQDFYDDLDVRVVRTDNQLGLLFASNRPDVQIKNEKLDTILPITNMNIFYYDLENRSTELIQITNTPGANERQPVGIDTTYFSYLSDEIGITNRYTGKLEEYIAYYNQRIIFKDDTEIIIPQDSILERLDSTLIADIKLEPVIKKRAVKNINTNFGRNIELQDIVGNQAVSMMVVDGEYKLYNQAYDPLNFASAKQTVFIEQIEKYGGISGFSNKVIVEVEDTVLAPQEKNDEVESSIEEEEEEIDIDNYSFQSEFDDEEEAPIIDQDQEDGNIAFEEEPSLFAQQEDKNQKNNVLKFKSARTTAYRTKFRTDFITTNLDNSLLFDGLNTFSGTDNTVNTPAPGILLKGNFKDLFEDYEFEGGVRLPTTFNGSEFFLTFDSKKKKLDKRFAAYRRVTRQRENAINTGANPSRTEFTTTLGQYEVRYPLDIFTSIRGRFTLRNDRISELSTDILSLNTASVNQQRAGIRLEYVFDNTLDVSINIKNGTRYKVFAELVRRFSLDFEDQFEFDAGNGFLTVLGLDARHYQRLDKHSIFALRAAASTSFGQEKILYFLGGTDNWLFNQFDNDIPIPSGNFAYQTLATNIRGFDQNIRNGTSYALLNAEFRIPVIRYFSRRAIRSNFLRNFQLMVFGDVGTAWHGKTPFSTDNPLNIVEISNPDNPVILNVNFFRDPIVAGYGLGARVLLFGYFLRLDYAWGIETRQIQDPRFYLSFGTDF